MELSEVILASVILAGIMIFLILDNYMLGGRFFDNEDFTDIKTLHHEHLEVLTFSLLVVLLVYGAVM